MVPDALLHPRSVSPQPVQGDRIVAVDGRSVRGWTLEGICAHMVGDEGTPVTLDVLIKPRKFGITTPEYSPRPDAPLLTHQVFLCFCFVLRVRAWFLRLLCWQFLSSYLCVPAPMAGHSSAKASRGMAHRT